MGNFSESYAKMGARYSKEERARFIKRLRELNTINTRAKFISTTLTEEGFLKPSGDPIDEVFIYQMKSRYLSEPRGEAAMRHLNAKDREPQPDERPPGILEELSELERNQTEVDDQEPVETKERLIHFGDYVEDRKQDTRFPVTELPTLAAAILRDGALRAEQKVKMLLVYTEV